MDPDRLERALTPRTKRDPARPRLRPSRGHGPDPRHRRPGTACPSWRTRPRPTAPPRRAAARARLGHAACFSFYPAKNLGAYGDAGHGDVSDDPQFVDRVRRLGNHGAGPHRYDNVVAGTNSRLDALQAAVLRVKLRHLDAWNAERRRARARLHAGARGRARRWRCPRSGRARARPGTSTRCASRDRERLQRHLARAGIATAVHYPRPIHLQPAMAVGGRPAGRPARLGAAVRARCSRCRSIPSCRWRRWSASRRRCGGPEARLRSAAGVEPRPARRRVAGDGSCFGARRRRSAPASRAGARPPARSPWRGQRLQLQHALHVVAAGGGACSRRGWPSSTTSAARGLFGRHQLLFELLARAAGR